MTALLTWSNRLNAHLYKTGIHLTDLYDMCKQSETIGH